MTAADLSGGLERELERRDWRDARNLELIFRKQQPARRNAMRAPPCRCSFSQLDYCGNKSRSAASNFSVSLSRASGNL